VFRRRRRARWFLLLLAAGWIVWRVGATLQHDPQPRALAEGEYRLRRVVDGDTLVLATGTRIRLIGVDCPEMARQGQPAQPLAQEATEFTRRFLAKKTLRLSFDKERFDRHGRTLAYVWVDDKLLNEALVEAGLARVGRQYRFSSSVKRRLIAAEERAKRAGSGIWALGP
jgi:micrococcal nuclease